MSIVDDIKNVEDHLLLFMVSCEIAKGLSKGQTLKDLKLAQQDKVCKWFIAMCSKGKPVSGFINFFLWLNKTMEKCIFPDGWLQNFKEPRSVWVMCDNLEYLIIQHLSGHMWVSLMEFYGTACETWEVCSYHNSVA